MAMTAVSPIFVDTNILVYAGLAQSPLNLLAVRRLNELEESGAELWMSRQILREYLASMTRPGAMTITLPINSLIADVRRFSEDFHVAEDSAIVTAHLLTLLATIPCGGKQIHDANIVATMQAHGIRHLLTHNVADFARFGAHITVLPLA